MKIGEVKPWEDPGFEEDGCHHDPNLDENESDSDYRVMEEFLRRNDDPEVDLVAILGEN